MRVHVNGVEINVEIDGGGPALILLHGNGELDELVEKTKKLKLMRMKK